MEIKLVIFWILGSLLTLGGAWIIGNLEMTVGVTQVSYAIAVIASMVMFLLAGLCWISVAVAAKHA